MAPIAISPVPTIVTVHSTLQSALRGYTTIEVLDGATVVATFTVTSIKHPMVNFKGCFKARFAADWALPFKNPMYTAVLDTIPPPPGWTWGLEGEPDFVPAVGNVPENLEPTGVGRVIRLNNPVSLRSHAAPVVSAVVSITSETTTGTEKFSAGDPLIGQPVDFGPDTYFADNNSQSSPGLPKPEEYRAAARKPLGLFQIRIGNPSLYFRGSAKVGPFTHKATMQNEHTRSPDSRPIANGLVDAMAELAEFGLPIDVTTFSDPRIDLLVLDYNALSPGFSLARRSLVRRIGHLLGSASSGKQMAVQAAHPGVFTVPAGTFVQNFPTPNFGPSRRYSMVRSIRTSVRRPEITPVTHELSAQMREVEALPVM